MKIDPDIPIKAERLNLVEVFAADDDCKELLVAIETDAGRSILMMKSSELRTTACWLYAAAKLADSGETLPWKPLATEVN